jgi:hypothetical protein
MPAPKDRAAAFVADAREFIDAVELLHGRSSNDSLPCYFMLGRAIELSLKAFLTLRGMKPWTLSSRDYGHDLVALLERSIARGLYSRLQLAPLDSKSVDLLNQEYVCTRLSYRASGQWHRLPVFARTLALANSLVAAMEFHLADIGDA